MLEQFNTYIREQDLCKPGDHILLAVSGGIDSVAMAHLFRIAGYRCSMAHCNFQLRGADSESDEQFVRALAFSLKMPFFVKKFDVDERMREEGISLQMAARELRYEWFEELLTEHGCDYLATAHNKNDSVETFIMNLMRGTGIKGLTGIAPGKGKLLRPLLFASREDIIAYRNERDIEFREDTSNMETKYRRNKIRHDIIPIMEQINPAFLETMTSNMDRLNEIHEIFSHAVEQARKEIFKIEPGRIRIDAAKLKMLKPLGTWLFELFSPYGFSRLQCEGIEKIIDAAPGRHSISTTHQLYKDRSDLILVPSKPESFDRYYLDSPRNHSSLPFPMDVEVLERHVLEKIPSDQLVACLDLDEIQFPLTIRHWMHGDYFFPLGMDQIKKLSDFFVDQKIPVPEKQRTWIMASGKKIVWIMGHRIDNRFRITGTTTKVLLLRLQPDVIPESIKESL